MIRGQEGVGGVRLPLGDAAARDTVLLAVMAERVSGYIDAFSS